MKKIPILGSALTLLLALSIPTLAQTTGSIRGVVLGPDATVLPGATVEARSSSLQGTRVATSDGQGKFVLSLLPPGTYTVSVTLAGFGGKVQTTPVGLGQDVNLRFELAAVATETVSVTAAADIVETSSNVVGRNLDSKVFESLPTGRNYSSIAQLTSGINTDESDSRNTSITVYGSTGLENSYLVDGANTTGVEIGNQGKVLNFEFIQEVEFKAGGYEAEYGGAQGGILNVVTKSGGNDFHGDVFGYFDEDSLQAT